MKTIVVPVDFSPASVNAAKYATDMALAINADIHLLHVYQLPVVYLEVPVAVTEEDLSKDAETRMMKLKADLVLKSGSNIPIGYEIKMGVFFSELRTVCDRIKPYTVVMGSQGSTAAERFFFGGHAVYTMKHLTWPVITVPPGATFSSIKNIGLAFDFSKMIEEMPIEEIKSLLKDFNASLHVLNTAKQNEFDADIVFESSMLEEIMKPFKPIYHFITSDDVDEGIMDFADKNDIDLLMVLPKRHGLVERLIHKSHSKQMVLHSHIPVMSIHQ